MNRDRRTERRIKKKTKEDNNQILKKTEQKKKIRRRKTFQRKEDSGMEGGKQGKHNSKKMVKPYQRFQSQDHIKKNTLLL